MKAKHIGIPVFVMLIYICAAVIFRQFIGNAIVVTLLADAVIILLGYLYYIRVLGDNRLAYSAASLGGIAAAGLGVWFVVSVTTTWMQMQPWYNGLHMSDIAPEGVSDMTATLLYLLLSLIVAPVFEEILFRGIMLRHFKQVMPIAAAHIVTAVVFGLFHGNIGQFYVGFFCGLFFALVYEYTGNLHISMATHMVYNLMVVWFSGIIALPEVLFTLPVVIPLNIILIAVFIVSGVYIYSRLPMRAGKQEAGSGSKLVGRLFAPAKPIEYIRVCDVIQLLMPGVLLMVVDGDGMQLYCGPVEGASAVTGLEGRVLVRGSLFPYTIPEQNQVAMGVRVK